ncbi:MAG: hypothetical protein RIF32_09275, partial [Leptospirales bacterium]
MKYDKIRGKSVAECMMKLRSAHGSQAIILSTREVQEGGLLGSGLFSRKLYEIDFMLSEEGAGSASRPLISTKSGRDRSALGRALLDAATARHAADSAGGSGNRIPSLSDDAGPTRAAAAETNRLAALNSIASGSVETAIPPLASGLRGAPAAAGPGNAGGIPALQTPEELALEREALDMLLAESPELEGLPAASRPAAFARSGAGRFSAAQDSGADQDQDDSPPNAPAYKQGVDRLASANGAGSARDGVMTDYSEGSARGADLGAGDERFGRILH